MIAAYIKKHKKVNINATTINLLDLYFDLNQVNYKHSLLTYLIYLLI